MILKKWLIRHLDTLRRKKYVCCTAFFFILTGILAGFFCAGALGEEERAWTLRLILLWGVPASYAVRLVRFLWWRLLGWLLCCFFCLWLLGGPLALASILLLSGVWGLAWGCVFVQAGFWQALWIVILFVPVCLAFIASTLQLGMCGLENLKKAFHERNIPRTALDTYKEAAPFFIACGKPLGVAVLGTIAETVITLLAYQAIGS